MQKRKLGSSGLEVSALHIWPGFPATRQRSVVSFVHAIDLEIPQLSLSLQSSNVYSQSAHLGLASYRSFVGSRCAW